MSYLIPQSDLIQQPHILNSVANSIVWPRFTFSSYSTVPFIQKCRKFMSLFQFHSHISFNRPNLFNSVTNSAVLSNFTISSYSTVALIQQFHKFNLYLITQSYLFQQTRHILQCHKFGCIIQFHSLFSFNSSLYSTVSQIQLYYLIPQSNLIQQFHIFNNVTNLIVLSRFTFSSLSTVALIQYCHKFSCISSFTFISLSIVQTYSKV